MMNNLFRVRLRRTLTQLLRFGIVGVIGAIIDFGSYNLMTRFLGFDVVYCLYLGGESFITNLSEITSCRGAQYPIVPANMISVFLAITSNFFLNKFWTFRDRTTSHIAMQGFGFFVMSTFTWTLNQFFTGFFASRLFLLEEITPDHVDNAAKVLAILVVMFFNFAGSKFIIFRKKKPVIEQTMM